jgi:hypothetical protein
LLVVALLQIWSYPMHDPVMMDRGFLADRKTTRRSFYHAFWISFVCLLAFGLVGVYAGLHRFEGEALMDTLARLLTTPALMLVNLALIVSAVSTLDSTLSSASKLVVVDMKLAAPTVRNGRIAMAAFMMGGLALLFLGSEDLFSAVAISGTASMFLAPVVIFCIWGGLSVPRCSYVSAFTLAMAGALDRGNRRYRPRGLCPRDTVGVRARARSPRGIRPILRSRARRVRTRNSNHRQRS